jgi:hypothetical protein
LSWADRRFIISAGPAGIFTHRVLRSRSVAKGLNARWIPLRGNYVSTAASLVNVIQVLPFIQSNYLASQAAADVLVGRGSLARDFSSVE